MIHFLKLFFHFSFCDLPIAWSIVWRRLVEVVYRSQQSFARGSRNRKPQHCGIDGFVFVIFGINEGGHEARWKFEIRDWRNQIFLLLLHRESRRWFAEIHHGDIAWNDSENIRENSKLVQMQTNFQFPLTAN